MDVIGPMAIKAEPAAVLLINVLLDIGIRTLLFLSFFIPGALNIQRSKECILDYPAKCVVNRKMQFLYRSSIFSRDVDHDITV
jgi:hypothetical protein